MKNSDLGECIAGLPYIFEDRDSITLDSDITYELVDSEDFEF